MNSDNIIKGFPKVKCHESKCDIVNLIKEAELHFPRFLNRIVDGGAGVGSTIASIVGELPFVKVDAFEPLPENARVLRARFAEHKNVTIHELAISDYNGSAVFDVPIRIQKSTGSWVEGTSYGGYLRGHGFSSLLLENLKKIYRRIKGRKFTTGKQSVKVKVVRLDSIGEDSYDIIKLDLQGGEASALVGLGSKLKMAKAVKVEVQLLSGNSFERCLNILAEHKFKPYVDDFQFSIPSMGGKFEIELREKYKLEIERVIKASEYDAQTMVIGRWPTSVPLPIEDMKCEESFRRLLESAKANYFQIDLFCINTRYCNEWSRIFDQEITAV